MLLEAWLPLSSIEDVHLFSVQRQHQRATATLSATAGSVNVGKLQAGRGSEEARFAASLLLISRRSKGDVEIKNPAIGAKRPDTLGLELVII